MLLFWLDLSATHMLLSLHNLFNPFSKKFKLQILCVHPVIPEMQTLGTFLFKSLSYCAYRDDVPPSKQWGGGVNVARAATGVASLYAVVAATVAKVAARWLVQWHNEISRRAAPPAISAAHFTISITAVSRVATLFQITYLGVGELWGLQRGHVAPQPELLHLQPL